LSPQSAAAGFAGRAASWDNLRSDFQLKFQIGILLRIEQRENKRSALRHFVQKKYSSPEKEIVFPGAELS
jgi:hypothetical protein